MWTDSLPASAHVALPEWRLANEVICAIVERLNDPPIIIGRRHDDNKERAARADELTSCRAKLDTWDIRELNTGDEGTNLIVRGNALKRLLSLAASKYLLLARYNKAGHCPLDGAAWIDQHNTHAASLTVN
jgi:hypothetical protein